MIMRCLRCGNEDPSYFYKGSKGWYCRKCVRFSRVLLEEELNSFDYEIAPDVSGYRFDYELTAPQKEASDKCLAYLMKDSDVLLHCVCGAGKTEIAVASISFYLERGLRVCYAISRREVVIELSRRFEKIFPRAKVTSVYGGHHERLDGDLIVCTCHQLYRYYRTFDLLILDEADAFPLKGDEALMNIALSSCRGRVIFSTATVDGDLEKVLKKRDTREVRLYVRPSFRPLSIPKVYHAGRFLSLLILYGLLRGMKNRCIVFVSRKRDCRSLYLLFSRSFDCTYVHADLAQRKQNIEAFRQGRHRFIFSTSVLERGITIRGIDVIILDVEGIFDESSLVQMLGRVGRGTENDEGRSYVICSFRNKMMKRTLDHLKEANAHL